jgi:peroxiredoxin
LILVFALAGMGKLADQAGSRQAMRDFGVPTPLAGPLGTLLPLTELAVAVALVPSTTAWWGALGVLSLLALFAGGIGYNMARGRQPDCHCFGRMYSAPIGWPTLLRNLVPAVLAGFVTWQGPLRSGPSLVDWIGPLPLVARVGLVLAVVLPATMAARGGWLARAQPVRQLFPTSRAADQQPERPGGMPEQDTWLEPLDLGLIIGSRAPSFALGSLHGETTTLASLCSAGLPVLLVFSDPRCDRCGALLPDLGIWQRDHASRLTIALISRLTLEANRAKSAEYGLTTVLVQHNREVATAYGATSLPTAVLVLPDGTIGRPPAAGAAEIEALVQSVTAAQ